MGIYKGQAHELGTELKDNGIEYAFSIGRRAPMHQGHVFCLRDILEAGLLPITGIGSANMPGNTNYDPIKNPLTPAQQKEQLAVVARNEFPGQSDAIMRLVFEVEDVGNSAHWSQNVIAALHEKVRQELASSPTSEALPEEEILQKCAMHFCPKEVDNQAQEKIKPLSNYTSFFEEAGISIWQSNAISMSHSDSEEISASAMRDWDLNTLSDDQYNALAAPDYIIALANAARRNNPDGELLDVAGIPVTMLDLSLERLHQEAEVSTLEVMEKAGIQGEITLGTLREAANEALAEFKDRNALQARCWVDLAPDPRQRGERPHTFGAFGSISI